MNNEEKRKGVVDFDFLMDVLLEKTRFSKILEEKRLNLIFDALQEKKFLGFWEVDFFLMKITNKIFFGVFNAFVSYWENQRFWPVSSVWKHLLSTI